MDTIAIRYGETVTLDLDTGDTTDVSATLIVGRLQADPILTKTIALVSGIGTFMLNESETLLEVGTYKYQINVTTADSSLEKFPAPDTDCADCEADLPDFIVFAALDSQEVS